MTETGYQTSSGTVTQVIKSDGLSAFIVRKIKHFNNHVEAYAHETKFLLKVKVPRNPKFYNKHVARKFDQSGSDPWSADRKLRAAASRLRNKADATFIINSVESAKTWLKLNILDKNQNPSRMKKVQKLSDSRLSELKKLCPVDNINSMIFSIMNDVTPKLCPECNKNHLIVYKGGRSQMFCSLQCLNKSDYMKTRVSELQQATWSDPNKAESIMSKRKATNLEKYGAEHILQIPGVKMNNSVIQNNSAILRAASVPSHL